MDYRRNLLSKNLSLVLVISAFKFCQAQVVSSTSPSVRLVGGETPYDGRVEAFLAGSGWSPLLRSSWGATDASIVCNELGYHGFRWWSWQDDALVDDTRLRLVNVRCSGNETSIVRCAYKTTLSYQTAATVACNYESYVGCYNNGRNDPIFSNHIKYSRWMTIQKCLEYCYSHNMTYAGIVNGNRCYCGDRDSDYGRFGRASDEMCTARCQGDYNQICGGIDEASIYLASMGSCGGHVNGSGTIFSPGFPGTLPRTIGNCTWIVTSPLGTRIEVEFTLLRLKRPGDHVVIFENPDGKYQEVGRIDYSTATDVWRSCSNEVFVEFRSETQETDGEGDGGMFALKVNEVTPECEIPVDTDPNADFTVVGVCPYKYTVTCHQGYEIETSHSHVWCKEDGSWNDVIPHCAAVECGDPGNVTNAVREGDRFTYFDTVKYTCNPGFVRMGYDVIFCTRLGTWSEKPQCVRNVTIITTIRTLSSTESKSYQGAKYIINLCVVLVILILAVVILVLIIFWVRKRNLKKRNVGLASLIRRLPKQSIRRIRHYDTDDVIVNRCHNTGIAVNPKPANENGVKMANGTGVGIISKDAWSSNHRSEKTERINKRYIEQDEKNHGIHNDTNHGDDLTDTMVTIDKSRARCVYVVHGYEPVKREFNVDNIPDACCGTGYVDNVAYESYDHGKGLHNTSNKLCH